MKNIKTTASALTLILALAACGGPPEEANVPEDPASPAAVASADTAVAPDAAATDAAAADATPTPAASESVAATPSPSATPTTAASAAATPAARASATAAPVAAAGPPPAFAQCSVCHKVGPGENGLGPSLANVFNAKAGDVAGFTFSNAMKESGLTWNQATLDEYLRDPRKVVPGTTMAFGGVKDDARRQAIIDYLKSL
ncbi:c-type cytochrome [Altererythrobacter xixiisoli]|uniref:C-type cytochrome n=1 Tax=Croceibacterium xixiisoli TaxID=1476466 RepID=A0A6I4TW38_9SPHN|nr:c-type cytochrome [Croceibacterium xixiisoli]MXP00205.1 c-type cytochrome [Croceibacterium xixiisoli]